VEHARGARLVSCCEESAEDSSTTASGLETRDHRVMDVAESLRQARTAAEAAKAAVGCSCLRPRPGSLHLPTPRALW
jgi:hypothetical protein